MIFVSLRSASRMRGGSEEAAPAKTVTTDGRLAVTDDRVADGVTEGHLEMDEEKEEEQKEPEEAYPLPVTMEADRRAENGE